MTYVIFRSIGKLLGGAFVGARLGQFGQREQSWVGMTLLAQAGMAIGLAATLSKLWPEGGQLVETIILGSVVIFELIGPIAVRFGLVKAGEVPLLSLLRKRAPPKVGGSRVSTMLPTISAITLACLLDAD